MTESFTHIHFGIQRKPRINPLCKGLIPAYALRKGNIDLPNFRDTLRNQMDEGFLHKHTNPDVIDSIKMPLDIQKLKEAMAVKVIDAVDNDNPATNP